MKSFYWSLLVALSVTACQSQPICPSPTEMAEKRRQCALMQQQLQEAPRDRLQSRGALEEQYAAECEDLLYYRESHSNPEACVDQLKSR